MIKSINFETDMYYKRTIKAGKTLEIFKSYTKHNRPTKTGIGNIPKEETDRINRANAISKLTRKLNANFNDNDFHIVLTYRREERPGCEQAKENLKKFFRKLRNIYRKAGHELKYIHVTEYARKSIHHHVVINGFEGCVSIIKNLWSFGRVHFTPLDSTGQYRKLAEYLIKETDKTFREKNGGQMQRYTPSKNIITPEPKIEKIMAKSWTSEPKAIKGYYIDEESIYNGVNPFNGGLIQKYTLIRLPERRKRE